MASALPPLPSPSPSLPPPPPAAGGATGGGASSGAGAAPRPALHVVICCCGTRGDTQPFAALGLRLQRRGHRVTLATEARMEGFVRGFGLEWRCIAGDMTGALLQPGAAERLGDRSAIFTVPAMAKEWELKLERAGCSREDIFRSYEAALAGADVCVTGTFPSAPSFSVCEKRGIAWLPLLLDCAALPLMRTTAFPMHFTAFATLGFSCLNGWSYDVAHRIIWGEEGPRINAWRERELGLKPIRDRAGLAGIILRKRVPVMVACSTLFCGPRRERPADYLESWDVGGFAFVPSAEEMGAPIEPRLVAFLARAAADTAPVVYLGFGSMAASAATLVKLAADVCGLARCRAVIVAGWSDVDTAAAAGNDALLIVKEAPHDWLFPRVRCIVHHCGVGTAAAALRAGVPQVPVPFLLDQFPNSRTVVGLGVAPRAVAYAGGKLSAAAVAQAVVRAMDPTQPFAAAAARCGEFVRTESAGTLDRFANMVEGARPVTAD